MQGGVKRGRDEYERREKDAEEPDEPAAPIPGAVVCRSLRLAVVFHSQGMHVLPDCGRKSASAADGGRAALLSAMLEVHIACTILRSWGQDG